MTVSSTGGAPETPGKGTGPSPGLGITLAGSGSRTLPSAGSETPLAPEQRCRGAWLERVQLQGPVCSPRAATDGNADTLGSSCCEESGPEASPWANPENSRGPFPHPRPARGRHGLCVHQGGHPPRGNLPAPLASACERRSKAGPRSVLRLAGCRRSAQASPSAGRLALGGAPRE